MGDISTSGSNLVYHIHCQFVVGNFYTPNGNLDHSDHFGIHNKLGIINRQALFQNSGSKHDISTRQSTQGGAESKLRTLVSQTGMLATVLNDAEFDSRVGTIDGYSCDVKRLYGDGFALLGNAGEFLDPVFSSGVTIALKSASLAADVVDRQLTGLHPNWDREYANPLKQGVNTFREFVEGWYDGRLQNVIFSEKKGSDVKRMVSSILAGYAWDVDNPYVKNPSRLGTLAELCISQ